MKTIMTLAASALIAATATAQAETYQLKALGQPVATGLIQKNVEQPFFENFAEKTGIDATVDYKPLDVTGIKDTEQLRILKAGLFDIVSLRMSQVSRDEPTILGLDLVGLNPDYDTGRKTVAAFQDKVDAQLQAKFNTKLLGVWPFGPQVLFCEPEIAQLSDLKGKKVRVYDQNLANFVSSVGGTPVPIGFPDVHQSLARGVVDCAITGPSSANSAGWPEVTNYMLPVAFQLALNGYGINLDTWNKLSEEDQAKLEAGFDTLVEDIWTYSEELFDDAVRCNIGEEPCETVKKYDLKLVEISAADKDIIGNAVTEISFPTWAEVCDKQNASCSADWKAAIDAALTQ
ncbi:MULTISPECIES: TRAP transporter substrate-binding protein [Marinovum]|jgi:TRAP-type C4-dicarboxylate transport system substrate-binding protein|uniref:TRAP-type C4-dicarboxylate transport system, substrate-binding protein n=1 Tax=Marinovum algicola TaxID=42444 RepID=A0A975WEF1_9RHOB|nr:MULTISPECIES: TRAP transporter substrate-binding protein [Marinovum]AKO99243.1 TRAP-type C4-dicarboxylate transport system, periplasmic component [Marinovum algicola DG 898]MDD9746147.1 TRAP transporter substrate-binding protein [Marinovum sp. PR37]SEK07275.1 TRAP-type C4-dicarboxylate transport system, substrate-binding protein [Marinovum algicola]SLN75798.1 Lactate-binding periplasmic protein precursor [Marinovum algicola]